MRCFFILRRLPSGYTAPAITITSGLTSFIDQRDVLGYCLYQYNTVNPIDPVTWTWIRPSIVLYEGDSIVLQAVSNNNSTGLLETQIVEFGSRYL